MGFINLLKRIKARVSLELKPYGFFRNYILFPIAAFFRCHKIFGMHKPYDKIEQIKGIHKGERCFIIATGPSLRVEDVELIKNEYTIGINTIFKIFENIDWRPDYYVMLDPNLHKSLYAQALIDLDDFAQKLSIVNSVNRNIIEGNKVVQLNYCWLDHIYHYGKSKRFKYNSNLLHGVYDCYSVTQACIQIAMYMGFKEIYLLGVDNNYLGKNQHFTKTKGEFKVDEDHAYKMQMTNDWGYEYIAEIAKKNNVKVFNATRGGRLEAFERVSLDDIVKGINDEQNI